MGERKSTKADRLRCAEGDIKRKGFGIIPKVVMQDKDLSIESKAIYSYMASYAGAGEVAFPGVDKMIDDLGISRARFYKHRAILERTGYITIETTREDGKRSNNIYVLNQTVDKNKANDSFLQSQNLTVENLTEDNLQSQNLTVENLTTNNNSIKNNSIKNNSIKNNSIKNNNNKGPVVVESKEQIETVINMLDKKVDYASARTILKAANEDMSLIKSKYEVAKATGYKNLGGYMVRAIKEDWQMPKESNREDKPKTAFHNFESRTSNYTNDQLEAMLRAKNG